MPRRTHLDVALQDLSWPLRDIYFAKKIHCPINQARPLEHGRLRYTFQMKFCLGLRIAISVIAVLMSVVSANGEGGCWESVSHYNRGLDLQIKGDLDAAITEYRTSMAQCPTFWRPVYNLGTVLEVKGDIEGAAAQYRAVISKWPNIWQAHLALGNILEDKGENEAAIVEYHAVIKNRKKEPEAHYRLGRALQATGDLQGAILEYRTAIRLKPDYTEAKSAISEALKSTDKSSQNRTSS